MKVAILTTDNRDHYRDYGCPTPYFGTAPEALLQGFQSLPNVEVHVLSCLREQASAPRQIGANIYFHGLHVPKWGWMRTGYQGCIRAIRRKLREIDPDIVHGQGSEHECAIAAVYSGFPNVLTIHGNMVHMLRVTHSSIGSYFWLAARLETLALRRTGGVFCNSEHTEKAVRPRARRTWRVPNAVKNEFFSPTGPAVQSKPRLLNVGVISNYKRQIELLDALADLRGRGCQFEVVFAGHANHSAYAIDFVEKVRQFSDWASYVGLKPTAELIKLMDQCSALVHVPLEESFGLVVAEALARGLKFFGFRVGGVPDIAHGVPGTELFEENDWTALGSSLTAWLQQGGSRNMEAPGLMKARYSSELIAKRHVEIYREVLTSGCPRAEQREDSGLSSSRRILN